jgi:hypothetical protein
MRTFAGVSAVLGMVLVAVGCHGSAPKSGAWPAEFKKGVLDGCAKTNPTPGVCDCVSEALAARVPFVEFVAYTQAESNGKTPQPATVEKVKAAVASCQGVTK